MSEYDCYEDRSTTRTPIFHVGTGEALTVREVVDRLNSLTEERVGNRLTMEHWAEEIRLLKEERDAALALGRQLAEALASHTDNGCFDDSEKARLRDESLVAAARQAGLLEEGQQ